MNPLLKKSLRFFLMLFVYTASFSTTHAQQLPATWQPGMALTTWYGAGMRDQTDSLRIAGDSSFERHNGMDNNKKYSFHFTQQELNDLLQFLKEKHFDKIKTNGPVAMNDGWSSDISLHWGNNYITVETGAAYDVQEAYKKDLSDILQYVYKLVEQKKKQRK